MLLLLLLLPLLLPLLLLLVLLLLSSKPGPALPHLLTLSVHSLSSQPSAAMLAAARARRGQVLSNDVGLRRWMDRFLGRWHWFKTCLVFGIPEAKFRLGSSD